MHSLRPKEPFRFEHSLDFLSMFRPMFGEQAIGGRAITKSFRQDGATIRFEVDESLGVVHPSLEHDPARSMQKRLTELRLECLAILRSGQLAMERRPRPRAR